jgi:riboflavin transporter
MTDLNGSKPTGLPRSRVRWITKTGILAAIAVVLMYLEFSLPLMPPFLKFDFSEIAVLMAAFTMGPLTGIIVELIKNLIHYPFTQSNGVGELANFLVGSAFVGTAGIIYHYVKTRLGAAISMAGGTVAMTLVACLVNYFVVLPFYFNFFPLDKIIELCQMVGNTKVVDMTSLIVYVFIPFNLFKGLVISLIVGLLYKRISPILHR